MSVFSLKDKVAVITGASRGIGESIAMTLAEYGAHCILVSRKLEGLEAVAGNIREKGGKADPAACHTGDMEQIAALISMVKEKFGRLDILINNAATNPYFGEMIHAEESHWDKIFEVNLKGPFFLIKHAAGLMAEGKGGAIVNVSSVNGVRPGPFQGIYSISKAAIISMTKAYAKELAPKNIRVNALLPGLTDTKFASALIHNEQISKMILPMIPMGRFAQPSEMAGAVLYLVSDASSYTTGTCITCDGGLLV